MKRKQKSNQRTWKTVRLDSLSRFLERVEHEVNRLDWHAGEDAFPLFRGVADGRWSLMPTLFREFAQRRTTTARRHEIESDLFFEFEARASGHVPGISSDWDTLFLMRHHAVPTRLLDWTETLLMAAYFALRFGEHEPSFEEGHRPRIWILNPYALNGKRSGWSYRDLVAPRFLKNLSGDKQFSYATYLGYRKPISWPVERPVALYPVHTNARLRAQRGYFTLHGRDESPVDKQLSSGSELSFVEIDENMYEPLLNLLDHAGLTHFLMQQSLDGLARDLRKTYLS
jgi:hypothetical protein